MSLKRILAGNMAFSLANFVLRAINSIVVFAVLARIFSLSRFGIITFLLTVIVVCVNFMDFGYRMVLVKDVSVDKNIVNQDYLYPKILTKILLFTIIMIMAVVYFFFKEDWNIPIWLAIIFVSTFFLIDGSNFLFSFFQAVNKFHLETRSLALFTIGNIIGVALAYKTGLVWAFLGSYMFGALLMFLNSAYLFYREFQFDWSTPLLNYTDKVIPEIKRVLPFAAIVVTDILLVSIDSLYLESYVSKDDLGLYMGMNKIVTGLSIFAVILYAVFFPLISRSTQTRSVNISKILLLFFIVGGLGLIIFAGYYVFNEELIVLALGYKFLPLKEFDLYMILFTFSRYLRIVPMIYLVTNGWEVKRLWINIFLLIVMAYFLNTLIPTGGIKAGIKILSYTNFMASVIMSILFIFAIFFDRKKSIRKVV